MTLRDERPLSAVPLPVFAVLLAALALHIAMQWVQPRPVARAEALEAAPAVTVLRAASLGEPVAMAQLTALYLQAFDNQPGISVPFKDLDYARVIQWLARTIELDPLGQYPLLLASQVYLQVPDPARQRLMGEFVLEQFLLDPDRRWRWLAHVAIMAKHRLHDNALALRYAAEITRAAPAAPSWARQMQIFILEDIGELESAKIMLGGLLATGQVTDEHELRFLTQRLEALKAAEKHTTQTKIRQF